jgi:hypothetical protein
MTWVAKDLEGSPHDTVDAWLGMLCWASHRLRWVMKANDNVISHQKAADGL